MRKTSRPIKLMLLACLAGAAGANLRAEEPLTLAQALARALERNPELAIDAPLREAAGSDLSASRAGYMPRVDFEQSYAGGNNPVYVFGTLLTQRRICFTQFFPMLAEQDMGAD